MALSRAISERINALAGKLEPGRKPVVQFARPRNTDGEFEPEADAVPDPTTMRAAYGPPPDDLKRPGVAKPTAGVVAGLGGTAAAALLLARRRQKA